MAKDGKRWLKIVTEMCNVDENENTWTKNKYT